MDTTSQIWYTTKNMRGGHRLNLALCDDEQVFLNSLSKKIMDWARRAGHTRGIIIHTFSSSEELLEAWQHGMIIDALFLDIQIPGEMSGLTVAKEIHQINEHIPIVFITSYSEYAMEGYKFNALRFLHKPVSDQAVFECMDILWHRWLLRHTDCIMIHLPTQLLHLPMDLILYVESSGHYCLLHTADTQRLYKIKLSLGTLKQQLPASVFAQCHRSFIVNLFYIRNISHGCITMANGTTIQMSRSYQSQLIRQFRQYYLGGSAE